LRFWVKGKIGLEPIVVADVFVLLQNLACDHDGVGDNRQTHALALRNLGARVCGEFDTMSILAPA
jgi:hypothetical protein